jgi:hypothetical protein
MHLLEVHENVVHTDLTCMMLQTRQNDTGKEDIKSVSNFTTYSSEATMDEWSLLTAAVGSSNCSRLYRVSTIGDEDQQSHITSPSVLLIPCSPVIAHLLVLRLVAVMELRSRNICMTLWRLERQWEGTQISTVNMMYNLGGKRRSDFLLGCFYSSH